MNIDRIFDMLFHSASRIVATGKGHQPVLLVFKEDGGMDTISGARLPDASVLAHLHQQVAAGPDVLVAALITEIWVLETPDLALKARIERGELRVADHPDRQEAIFFNLLTPTRQAIARCPIDRAAKTLLRRELLWVDEDVRMEGRFVRSDRPPMH